MHMEEGFREGQPRGSGSAGSAHASSHVCVHVQAGLSQAPSGHSAWKIKGPRTVSCLFFFWGGGAGRKVSSARVENCVSGIPY